MPVEPDGILHQVTGEGERRVVEPEIAGPLVAVGGLQADLAKEQTAKAVRKVFMACGRPQAEGALVWNRREA